MRQSDSVPSVIFDIGSGSVGGALVLTRRGEKPNVLYAIRKPIRFSPMIRFEELQKNMIESLNAVAGDIVKTGLVKTSHLFSVPKYRGNMVCVLTSPWYITSARELTFSRKKPFTINERFIEKLLVRAEKHFEQSLLKNAGDGVETPRLIEQKVVETRLNGYPTKNPYGKQAMRAEITLLLSMMEAETGRLIEATLQKIFNARDVGFHSFALVSFATIRDLFSTENSFFAIHISAEVTDLFLVRDGVLVETVSFPLGKHFLIRDISGALRATPTEVRSLISLTISDKYEQGQNKAFELALAAANEKWQDELTHALQLFSENNSFPKTAFLAANDDLAAWFGKIVGSPELSDFTLTKEPYSVVILDSAKLAKHLVRAKNVARDSFLDMEALFIGKLHNS